MYANQSEDDIILKDDLEDMQEKHNRFKVSSLSSPPPPPPPSPLIQAHGQRQTKLDEIRMTAMLLDRKEGMHAQV